MAEPIYLLYLDCVHQADPLFVQGLARALASAVRLPRCILLHGSGDRIARMLEAGGYDVDAPGVRVPPSVVERVVREETRRIVEVLTDAGVSAVGFQGTDRGMLRRSEDGGLVARGASWVHDLTEKRVVPVVSALVHEAGGETHEARMDEVAVALAKTMETEEVGTVFFTPTDRPGVIEQGALRPEIQIAGLSSQTASSEPDAVRRIVASGGRVWLTSPFGLVDPQGLRGTRVIA